MDLSGITPQQAQEVAARLRPALGYLVRLTGRMQQRGWLATDPAYVAAWAARDALHELMVRLHYRTTGLHLGPDGRAPERAPRPWEPGGDRGA